MNQDLGELGRASATNFTVNTFSKVENTRPNDKPPALITETVLRRVEGEGCDVVRVNTVTDEATSSMTVKSNHEKECRVMGVPESLEALIANLPMRGSVHQEHDQEHEVTSDASSLCVVDVQRGLLSYLCNQDIIEISYTGGKYVAYGYAQH